ncbi:hypothetical protein RCL_e1293_RclHR1_13690007 [Rhizophagus clarus]|uniref:Uncharacterized protein n=1 Tax=Rhizophagus clarus TaxID=94130 RepID=A0A8H3M4C0_9GLOM|nr:hypothetical protein RCL_e1293_RclHR1_13690007 [Rhizophagus clarus]
MDNFSDTERKIFFYDIPGKWTEEVILEKLKRISVVKRVQFKNNLVKANIIYKLNMKRILSTEDIAMES